MGNIELASNVAYPGGDGRESLMVENAKGESRDKGQEDAVYQRGEFQ